MDVNQCMYSAAIPYTDRMVCFAGYRPLLLRYGLAEVAGTAAACAAAWLAYRAHRSPYAAGLSGSLAETAGYYAVIAWDETRRRAGASWLGLLPALLIEFGPAEVLDTLLVRPLLMAAGPALTHHPAAGTLAGKAAADLLFYAVVLPSRRLRRDAS